jgi:hypothetical protein
MGPLIVKCVDRLTSLLDGKCEANVNITAYLKRMTMDAIWNCAFGIDVDMQNDLKNDFYFKSEAVFSGDGKVSIFYTLSCNILVQLFFI